MKRTHENPAVLFVLIGWTSNYDGTQVIRGGHKHLKGNPDVIGELQAYVRQDDDYFRCGAGKGKLNEANVDVVFVARNPTTLKYEVVAIYQSCEWENEPNDNWCTVKTMSALLFHADQRPRCSHWPKGQLMRRWARRDRLFQLPYDNSSRRSVQENEITHQGSKLRNRCQSRISLPG